MSTISQELETNPAGADRLAYNNERGPDMATLQTEYDYAMSEGYGTRTNAWNLTAAEDVRYNRWPGQSRDGLKWRENMPAGEDCRPYDGAPDCRIPLADETIEAVVDILFAAFFAARMNPRPVHATKLTAQQSGEWKAIINWMIHGPLGESLINNVEFLAQCGNTFGWCILHPGWSRRMGWQCIYLHMDEITQYAAQAPEGSLIREIPAMVQSTDDDSRDALAAIVESLYPGASESSVMQCIKDLRERGEGELQVPVQVENVPTMEVLVPGIDFIAPPEMTDPQRSRVLFKRKFYNTTEVESFMAGEDEDARYSNNPEEGWNEDFVAAVKRTAGQGSSWTASTEQMWDENAKLIEISTAYAYQVRNGVPGIWVTVFSPNVRNKGYAKPVAKEGDDSKPTGSIVEVESEDAAFAKHYLLDMAHLKQPFLMYQTEVIGKRPDDARGIPEKLATQQTEMKRQRDALFVRAELETTPPLTKRGTKAAKLPPEFGPLSIFNQTMQGEWEWFAPPSGNPNIAFQLFQQIKQERDEQHGLPNPNVSPARWQARQKRQVMRFLMVFAQALWQASVLTYQNLSEEELTDVIGHPPLLTVDDLLKCRIACDFDVRTLDPDWVREMIAELKEIITIDTGGTIDHSKLAGFLLNYLDSTLADEVTTDAKGAAKKVFDDVRNEVLQMMSGNEAEYVDNDPTAKMKLQFLQQILMNNPEYIMQVHPQSPKFNERKAMLVQKYAQSLQQSVTQQGNKMVGRIGVKPMAMDKRAQGKPGAALAQNSY